jgi:hypothetical protein
MQNLSLRIEALEKAALALRRERYAIVESALQKLSPPDLELLISSYGAGREGRHLTDQESTARHSLRAAMEQECRMGRVHQAGQFDWELDVIHICRAMLNFLYNQYSLESCGRVARAMKQGCAPTEEELAALRVCDSQIQRLSQLAGFSSVYEFMRMCEETIDEQTGPAI